MHRYSATELDRLATVENALSWNAAREKLLYVESLLDVETIDDPAVLRLERRLMAVCELVNGEQAERFARIVGQVKALLRTFAKRGAEVDAWAQRLALELLGGAVVGIEKSESATGRAVCFVLGGADKVIIK